MTSIASEFGYNSALLFCFNVFLPHGGLGALFFAVYAACYGVFTSSLGRCLFQVHSPRQHLCVCLPLELFLRPVGCGLALAARLPVAEARSLSRAAELVPCPWGSLSPRLMGWDFNTWTRWSFQQCRGGCRALCLSSRQRSSATPVRL